jgi:hypothetical protein
MGVLSQLATVNTMKEPMAADSVIGTSEEIATSPQRPQAACATGEEEHVG